MPLESSSRERATVSSACAPLDVTGLQKANIQVNVKRDAKSTKRRCRTTVLTSRPGRMAQAGTTAATAPKLPSCSLTYPTVSYTHLRAHETVLDLVCRLLLE